MKMLRRPLHLAMAGLLMLLLGDAAPAPGFTTGRFERVRKAEAGAVGPAIKFFEERVRAATTPEELNQALSLTNEVAGYLGGRGLNLVAGPEGVSLAGTHLEGLEPANQYASAVYGRQRELIDLIGQAQPLAAQAGMDVPTYLRSIGANAAAEAVGGLFSAKDALVAVDEQIRSRAGNGMTVANLYASRARDPARFARNYGPEAKSLPLPYGFDPGWWASLSPDQQAAELEVRRANALGGGGG
jgi:hypothetical protein